MLFKKWRDVYKILLENEDMLLKNEKTLLKMKRCCLKEWKNVKKGRDMA